MRSRLLEQTVGTAKYAMRALQTGVLALDVVHLVEEKVALLDDDQSHNALVASVLDPAGFICTSFTTPSRLLAELRKQTFELIILDWNMPELSGVETLKLLH